MIDNPTSKIDEVQNSVCERHEDATPERVRRRASALLEEHDVSVRQIIQVIEADFAEEPSNVQRVESVKTAQMEPKEATLVGVVLTVTEQPAKNAREVWVSDGTDRIRIVLPASAISMTAHGSVRVFRRLGVKHAPERWAYARSRTEVERP
jgi:hypothetical protein